MKAWITKYALTDGIQEVEGEVSDIGGGSMFCYDQRPGEMSKTAHGKDWHRTKEAAVARAEQMRKAKLRTLQKQFSRLEDMKF